MSENCEKPRRTGESWSMSFGDDATFAVSGDLNDSVFEFNGVFDSSEANSSTNANGSVSFLGVSLEGSLNQSREDHAPLLHDYNVGEKRFERALGTDCVKNDIIKIDPVRLMFKIQMVSNRICKMNEVELGLADTETGQSFSIKNLASFADGEIEVFANEVTRCENAEVIYSDKQVQVLFATEGCYDPNLFIEQALEEFQLGSYSSYRNKIIVS